MVVNVVLIVLVIKRRDDSRLSFLMYMENGKKNKKGLLFPRHGFVRNRQIDNSFRNGKILISKLPFVIRHAVEISINALGLFKIIHYCEL